ncbi:hypothetical protein MTR_2g025255 [Medicago truncatula]|uniref:Uncharacterized protein n=1 Tax=Medicago truncatula TaxID=3880 RepID=A0A072V564_MEDTR|nr:hypothetical protein MTR_2g025255 [Medicago truncatula]
MTFLKAAETLKISMTFLKAAETLKIPANKVVGDYPVNKKVGVKDTKDKIVVGTLLIAKKVTL